ncbi:MAG: hypothetical protein ABI824_08160 [Acidobacteriota bacterium]
MPTNQMVLSQILSVVRLEMAKTFFSKRGLWVYLLALAPVLIYAGHSLVEIRGAEENRAWAAAQPVKAEFLQSIQPGLSLDQVVQRAGEPFRQSTSVRRNFTMRNYQYTDGEEQYTFVIVNDKVTNVVRRKRDSLAADLLIFATVFQFFYLRLAIFFGCVGVFTNLFRGELLDKSLHYYLLTPIRREVLAIGKYIAGLTATIVIFTTSTALQLVAMSWHIDRTELANYLNGPGWSHVLAYLGVTVAACVGYGGVFLAAGLLFKNPIIPAAAVQVWESANMFLPAILKKFSIIFYLQSLCPVVAPPDADMNPILKLLINSAEPVRVPVAILGLAAVTCVVLWFAAVQARRLEINYSSE